jgi:hypothetical protein
LLHIDLERPINEPDVRTIRIETHDGEATRAPTIEGKSAAPEDAPESD